LLVEGRAWEWINGYKSVTGFGLLMESFCRFTAMPGNLAPIGLSTYARLWHLQQTIAALQKNDLAGESELFVFSDAPRAGNEEKVESVRRYLRTIDGFKAVHIIERSENNRVANSRGGMGMLLDKYGKAIFLEEDIVTAPGFLRFMNQALDKYEHNERIFSVTGYCPPIPIPADYEHDLFFLRRFNGWGVGIWKDRFERVKYISPQEYEDFAARSDRVRLFVEGGGEDMMALMRVDAQGKIDAFDVKAMYAQFLSDQYTVYPSRSLTANIGLDGTGVHCGITSRFDVTLSQKKSFSFPDVLTVDHRIVVANLKLRVRPGYATRVVNKLRRIFA
jgi:hypothetical protein